MGVQPELDKYLFDSLGIHLRAKVLFLNEWIRVNIIKKGTTPNTGSFLSPTLSTAGGYRGGFF